MYKEPKKKREQDPRIVTGESFPVIYTIPTLELNTYFTLHEIGCYSVKDTVLYHARRLGLINTDFVCKITGLHSCIQQGRQNHLVRRDGWMEYFYNHLNQKFIIHYGT